MARVYAWAVAVALLAAGPLVAQENNAATATTVAPPPASDIGPRELSDFSLNGTVTRPAERPPAAQPTPPAARPEASPFPVGEQRPAAPAASTQSATREAAPATTRGTIDSDLFRRPPTLPDAAGKPPALIPAPDLAEASPPPLSSDSFSPLPWIAGMLAIAGIAVVYFGLQRRRQRPAPAGHPPIDILRKSPPAAEHEPIAPASPRAATPPRPGGARRPLPTTLLPKGPPPAAPVVPGAIVSTGLRPWLEIELSPDRALLDKEGAAIAFEVTLFNSGSAAARDVIIEARLINAGTRQDGELGEFFAAAGVKTGDPIPQIAPFARIPLRSAARLPRSEIRDYEFEGRKLFMPMVAISVRYRWSSGDGHSAAAFLVGAEGEDKLAPLRLDRGNRSWKGLAARRYEKGLRT